MIFNEDDDLRGCTVRLRDMEPGESLTIPMDAERCWRDLYVAYFHGLEGRAYQNTHGSIMASGNDIVEVLNRPEDLICEINDTAKGALKALLDDAEARDYNPPVPTEAVADLEWIIHLTDGQKA